MKWRDNTKVFNYLGPFAYALSIAEGGAQAARGRGAPVHPHLAESYFSHAFTTFRAAKMKEEWVHKWTEAVGGEMDLPMFTSTSLSPVAALEMFGLLKKGDDKELSTYLYVFTIASETEYFHLDSGLYSAFPEEQEVLLSEGRTISVLAKEQVYSQKYA